MQRIEIDNFGPIEHVCIELRPLVILIGEQASGKSTIAKLIYFFKTISDEFYASYLNSSTEKIYLNEHIIFPIRDKFNEFFGSTLKLRDFKIVFWYSENKFIALSLTEKKRLKVNLSPGFFSEKIKKEISLYKKEFTRTCEELDRCSNYVESVRIKESQAACTQALYQTISSAFESEHNDSLYIIAGRNSTVAFMNLFEDYYSRTTFSKLINNGMHTSSINELTIDGVLLLNFINKVQRIRQTFKNAGNFEGMIHFAPKDKKSKLILANNQIRKILHGQYADAADEERIVLGNKSVFLKDASSGQQESIRILQDIFLSIYSNNTVFRVIEEPEVHLYPESQKYLLELIAMVLNENSGNQIIITTHSPYVLSVINNLIYAYQAASMNNDLVNKIIKKEFWINPDNIITYQLNKGKAECIMEEEDKLIRAEKIDGVSEALNKEFDQLLDIEIEKGK